MISNGCMELKIVWYGNNGCLVSQEHMEEMGMALHLPFPDLLGILRFPEQGTYSSKW